MTRVLADTVADGVSATRAAFPGWNGRRILLANLVVLGVIVCFALLFRFAAALFILFVGVSLGMAVKPGVEWLRRRGLPRWVGALAVYAALGGLAAGVLTLAVPVVAEQTATLVARAPHHFERLRTELLSSESHTLQRIAWYLPSAVERSGTPAIDVSPSSTPAARWGGTCSRSWRCCCSVSTGRWRASAGSARWPCSRRSIAAGRSAASSPRSSRPSAPICAASRWSA